MAQKKTIALTVNLADVAIEITHRGKVARAYRTL